MALQHQANLQQKQFGRMWQEEQNHRAVLWHNARGSQFLSPFEHGSAGEFPRTLKIG